MTLSKILDGADFKGREYRITFLESTYTSVAWKCDNADDISEDDWSAGVKDVGQYNSLCTPPSTVEVADFQHGTYTSQASNEAGYACEINLVATGSDIPENVFDTTFYFTTMEDGSVFRGHATIQGDPTTTIFDLNMWIFSYAPTYTFVGNCFDSGRIWMQLFADGYGSTSCSGGTGDACAQVCADDCAGDGNCIGYYYGDQQKWYGSNALGQCVWFFDSVDACHAASDPNPYGSNGLIYGTFEEMTTKFCEDETHRSGPWVQADDDACTTNPVSGDEYFYSLNKKSGRGYGNLAIDEE